MQRDVYRDFDAFAGAVGDIDAVMMLQNPKRRIWSLDRLELAGVHVQLGRLGSGNIVEGQSWADGYLVYLPISTRCEYMANATSFGMPSFLVVEPATEICISTRDEHDWCSLLIPTHIFSRVGGLVKPESSPANRGCRVTRPNLQLANRFATFVHNAIAAATTCATFETSFAAQRAAVEARNIVASVIGGPPVGESMDGRSGRPRFSRQQIIHRCTDLLDEREAEPMLLSELATAAGVSERTLETAFKEYFGVSPRGYLQLRRLHAVHHALRAADPDAESVTDILVRHGEWEWGRFAARYRRLFGELPSETLRRPR